MIRFQSQFRLQTQTNVIYFHVNIFDQHQLQKSSEENQIHSYKQPTIMIQSKGNSTKFYQREFQIPSCHIQFLHLHNRTVSEEYSHLNLSVFNNAYLTTLQKFQNLFQGSNIAEKSSIQQSNSSFNTAVFSKESGAIKKKSSTETTTTSSTKSSTVIKPE